MKRFIARVIEIYKPFKKAVWVMFVLLIFSQALALISPYIYGKIIDGMIKGKTFNEVLVLIFVSLLIYVLSNVVAHYRDIIEIKKFDFDVRKHVAKKTLDKILAFSVGQHDNQNSGVKQSIINKGEHALSALAYTMLYDVFPLVFRVSLTVIALFFLNKTLGLIVLLGVLSFMTISILLNNSLRGDLKKLEDLSHETSKSYNEMLRNIKLILVHAQENKSSGEHHKKLEEISVLGKKTWIRYSRLSFLRNLVTGLIRFAVLVTGTYYVFKGFYTPGYLVVFLTWSSNAFGDLGNVGQIHRRCMELYIAINKYFTLMDIEPDIKVISNPVRPDKFLGGIEFRNVSFKYPIRNYVSEEEEIKTPVRNNGYEALSNTSFTIKAGQRVAFVGHSGAGKTTIISLITRAYDPDQGQVIIDNNDLRILDLKHYREAIGLVEQDVALFDNTLRYNVTFGLNGRSHDVTDEELNEIAKISCIDKFYHRLEMGFDTIIGEKGVKLSGGERQRVGIARALIKTPRILIFDEATSSLDTENEFMIRQSIENASRGRTTIIIAHRLSTIKDVDKIFVLDKSKIVGEGKHNELIKSCEAYKRLINNQVVLIN